MLKAGLFSQSTLVSLEKNYLQIFQAVDAENWHLKEYIQWVDAPLGFNAADHDLLLKTWVDQIINGLNPKTSKPTENCCATNAIADQKPITTRETMLLPALISNHKEQKQPFQDAWLQLKALFLFSVPYPFDWDFWSEMSVCVKTALQHLCWWSSEETN